MNSEALAPLERILNRKIPCPQAVHFHDWRNDRFSFFRRANGYVPPAPGRSSQILSEFIEDTLYFAGEACEREGHGAAAHGAIAPGIRAAEPVKKLPRSHTRVSV